MAMIAGLLALPGSASATTAHTDKVKLTAEAGAGEANDLILSYVYDSGYKYTVFEQGAGLDMTPSDATCDLYGDGSPPAVSCPDVGQTSGVLKMGDRADEVCACGAIPISLSLSILGGRGGDRLTGGQAPEVINGGRGDDVIFADGGTAADVVVGGAGADKLRGDPYGPDLLKAKDGERDKVIDCGPGPDPNAKYDHGLDPKPISC
jgi:Ca2+-binding RTX toxin-like protein